MRKTLILASICVLLLANIASAASISGDQVVASVRKTFAAVSDYRVEAKMSIKGSNISINNMAMTVFYKKPNKVHVKAKDGAALVPKGTMFGNPIDELTRGGNATYVKSEKKAGVDSHVIQITRPKQPAVTVWVDKQRSVILATRSSGDFTTSTTWRYNMIDGKYYMPVEVSAVMMMPAGSSFHHGPNGPQAQAPSKGPQQTKMSVSFSNYIINKGIDDKIFEEKPRK